MRAQRCLVAPIIAAILLLAGCSSPAPDAVSDEAAWKAELLGLRQQKDEQYRTSEASPMAGVQYLKSEPGRQLFLTRNGDEFGLAYEEVASAVVRFVMQADRWRFRPLSDEIRCIVGDAEVADGAVLDGPAKLTVERFLLNVYPGEDRVTLIVFDPERSEMQTFQSLLYFEPDPAYAVDARLVPFPDPEPVTMLTSRNLEKTFLRYAKIRFRLDGSEQELSAFKYWLKGEGSTILFIPFRDATSGKQSYGAGRFLEIEEPAAEQFVLDFNLSFNPLCNYSPAYNCAIPPRENHLDVAILAGEKTYPGSAEH